jgi:hypothetical protein
MIKKSTQRLILRWVHLVAVIPVAGYVYGDPKDVVKYADAPRFIFFPVLLFTGYWMWQSGLLAILGVALWLGLFHFLGFGAALLGQILLFIATKIYLVISGKKRI